MIFRTSRAGPLGGRIGSVIASAQPTGVAERVSGVEPSRQRERFWCGLGVAVIVAATSLAYVPALRGDYLWDDREYVWENPTLRSLAGLRQIWFSPAASPQYYPLTFTSFWLEYHVWGANPFASHLVNLGLHLANALLVWLLLEQLGCAGAFLAAAMFALHPVHVESVAWIAERKDVLCGVFSLLVVLGWMRFLDRRRWPAYVVTLLLFGAAMLSKTSTCTLPLVLLFLAWYRDGATSARRVADIMPFAAVAAGLAAITVWREGVGAAAVLLPAPLAMVDRILIAARAICFYMWELFWPLGLTTIYPRWDVDSAAAWQYVFPVAAVLAVLVPLWLRPRLGSRPLLAVACFYVLLAPVLGVVRFGYMRLSFVADHLQYIASIPITALASCALVAVVGGRGAGWAGRCIAAALLLGLGALTWRQGHIYASEVSLWQANLRENPQSWSAHYNLGTLLLDQGDLEAARAHLEAALRLNANDAQAHKNMGFIEAKQGNLDAAVLHFAAQTRLQPAMAAGHSNWGLALAMQGKLDDAVRHYEAALDIDPDHLATHYNLAIALEAMGRLDAAIEHYAIAARLGPDRAELQQELQRALAKRQGAPGH